MALEFTVDTEENSTTWRTATGIMDLTKGFHICIEGESPCVKPFKQIIDNEFNSVIDVRYVSKNFDKDIHITNDIYKPSLTLMVSMPFELPEEFYDELEEEEDLLGENMVFEINEDDFINFINENFMPIPDNITDPYKAFDIFRAAVTGEDRIYLPIDGEEDPFEGSFAKLDYYEYCSIEDSEKYQ